MKQVKHIFVDESGDLGTHGSKYFIVAAILTDDQHSISRIMRDLRKRKLKKKLRQLPEIKANNSNKFIREYVLTELAKTDCHIFAIAVDKSKILPRLHQVQDKLYNYICALLLQKISVEGGGVSITIDRKHTNTLIQDNFNSYIKKKLEDNCAGLDVEVEQVQSFSTNELQVVDFVAWSISRKFNTADDSYYRIVESKIDNKDDMELWKK